MAVSFKLNNADFLPLPFPSISKPVSSVSVSLSFTTTYKPFPCNVNIGSSKSFAIAVNTPISSFCYILQGNLFPICNRFKSSISDPTCNSPTRCNHQSICKSVHAFEPVLETVNFVSVPVCHHFHVVQSVFVISMFRL